MDEVPLCPVSSAYRVLGRVRIFFFLGRARVLLFFGVTRHQHDFRWILIASRTCRMVYLSVVFKSG